ncbi:hypothetical protein [Kaistella sp.]|uniref:hypothetical protein n=1 Tax=Kaistella sp. TaxID=2782235 RepID=UPI002F948F0B
MNEILVSMFSSLYGFPYLHIARSPYFSKGMLTAADWRRGCLDLMQELTAVGFIHLFFQQAEFPQLEDFN